MIMIITLLCDNDNFKDAKNEIVYFWFLSFIHGMNYLKSQATCPLPHLLCLLYKMEKLLITIDISLKFIPYHTKLYTT